SRERNLRRKRKNLSLTSNMVEAGDRGGPEDAVDGLVHDDAVGLVAVGRQLLPLAMPGLEPSGVTPPPSPLSHPFGSPVWPRLSEVPIVLAAARAPLRLVPSPGPVGGPSVASAAEAARMVTDMAKARVFIVRSSFTVMSEFTETGRWATLLSRALSV